MKVNIKVTPGLPEALAAIDAKNREAVQRACQEMARRMDEEFRAEYLPRTIAAYHLTDPWADERDED